MSDPSVRVTYCCIVYFPRVTNRTWSTHETVRVYCTQSQTHTFPSTPRPPSRRTSLVIARRGDITVNNYKWQTQPSQSCAIRTVIFHSSSSLFFLYIYLPLYLCVCECLFFMCKCTYLLCVFINLSLLYLYVCFRCTSGLLTGFVYVCWSCLHVCMCVADRYLSVSRRRSKRFLTICFPSDIRRSSVFHWKPSWWPDISIRGISYTFSIAPAVETIHYAYICKYSVCMCAREHSYINATALHTHTHCCLLFHFQLWFHSDLLHFFAVIFI